MAATARSVCASAPNIPIIADAGKVSNFGSDKKKFPTLLVKFTSLVQTKIKFQTLVVNSIKQVTKNAKRHNRSLLIL